MRLGVRSLALLSRLRIWRCCDLWCRGCRHGSDPELLWLLRSPAATAPIRPLTWEPPYAVGTAQEMAKRPKKKKKKVPPKKTPNKNKQTNKQKQWQFIPRLRLWLQRPEADSQDVWIWNISEKAWWKQAEEVSWLGMQQALRPHHLALIPAPYCRPLGRHLTAILSTGELFRRWKG